MDYLRVTFVQRLGVENTFGWMATPSLMQTGQSTFNELKLNKTSCAHGENCQVARKVDDAQLG